MLGTSSIAGHISILSLYASEGQHPEHSEHPTGYATDNT